MGLASELIAVNCRFYVERVLGYAAGLARLVKVFVAEMFSIHQAGQRLANGQLPNCG